MVASKQNCKNVNFIVPSVEADETLWLFPNFYKKKKNKNFNFILTMIWHSIKMLEISSAKLYSTILTSFIFENIFKLKWSNKLKRYYREAD